MENAEDLHEGHAGREAWRGSTGGFRRFVDCRHPTIGPNHKSTEKFDREDSRQVLFTEDQYARLLEIAKREGKKLGAVLRDAAEQVYLRSARGQEKAQAVRELLELGPIPAPDD